MAGDETVRLVVDMGQSVSNVTEVSTALTVLDKKVDEVAVSTEKLKSGAAGSAQSLLQTGRVIQDFAQGGLGGVLNNIEGLTVALGLGSGLAGVLTILGVVALTAGPAVKSFLKGIIDGSNEIPESTDKVKKWDESLKTTTERLEELRKQQHLTNTELAEFNRLTIEQTVAERNLEAARSAKKIEETLTPEQRKGADIIKRATDAFGGKAVIQEVAKALDATGQGAGDAMQGARNLLFNVERGDIKAKQVLEDAMLRGGRGTDIADILTGGATPAERREAERKANLQRTRDEEAWEKRQEAAEKKRKDDEKDRQRKIDELNQQGQENQRLGEEAMAKDQAEGIRRGREAGAAAAKLPPRGGIDLKGLDLGHLQMIPEGADMEEAAKIMDKNAQGVANDNAKVMQKLVQNQGQLTREQRNILQMIRRDADQVQAAIQENRTALSNGFP